MDAWGKGGRGELTSRLTFDDHDLLLPSLLPSFLPSFRHLAMTYPSPSKLAEYLALAPGPDGKTSPLTEWQEDEPLLQGDERFGGSSFLPDRCLFSAS